MHGRISGTASRKVSVVLVPEKAAHMRRLIASKRHDAWLRAGLFDVLPSARRGSFSSLLLSIAAATFSRFRFYFAGISLFDLLIERRCGLRLPIGRNNRHFGGRRQLRRLGRLSGRRQNHPDRVQLSDTGARVRRLIMKGRFCEHQPAAEANCQNEERGPHSSEKYPRIRQHAELLMSGTERMNAERSFVSGEI
jgi:hypothetical protein